MTVRPPRSISSVLLPASFCIAADVPDASTSPWPIASASWMEKSLSTVRILPLKSTTSAVWAEATLATSVTHNARAAREQIRGPDRMFRRKPEPDMSSLPWLFFWGEIAWFRSHLSNHGAQPNSFAQFRFRHFLQGRAGHLVDKKCRARHLKVRQRAAAGGHDIVVKIRRGALDAGRASRLCPRASRNAGA